MKITSFFSLFLAVMLFGFSNNLNAQDSRKPVSGMAWTSTTIDFGKIEQGKPVAAEFEFQNPTMVPLIISSVRPTCGCTIADYPKEPVQPGKSGKISVTFNAAASGVFTKSIIVTTNAQEGNTALVIKGEVVRKERATN
ncbi:MAG: DUF1573 domain-containing protein [Bacteroidales bacterium]|nr:DUF1573 domain-containing protein [Bacteroidales bacterium]